MRMIDIIEKKRDGKSLTKRRNRIFVNGYTSWGGSRLPSFKFSYGDILSRYE